MGMLSYALFFKLVRMKSVFVYCKLVIFSFCIHFLLMKSDYSLYGTFVLMWKCATAQLLYSGLDLLPVRVQWSHHSHVY